MKIGLFTILFLLTSNFYHKSAPINDNDNEQIGVWEIKNGIFIETDDNTSKLAKEQWKVFYGIFPKKVTQKYIKRLVLFSDGVDEKTGSLGTLSKENDEWQLGIDPKDVNFKTNNKDRIYQSLYTLIHEFGHLITLNNTQIKPTEKTGQTEEEPYLTAEGEAFKNSYINLFVMRFWSGQLLKDWDFIQKKYCYVEQKSCVDKLYGLYKDNYSDFLTDYAAESPEEDIVESWTAFVLEKKVEKPETVADQKINFFYQFPELVKYRKIIRKNIRKYIE